MNVDADRWQRAATAALGDREGTVLVIDPQTGRLLAVVNPRLAFSQAFPPGSTIKPFTALTAMRAHLLERATARQCSGRYARGNYATLCSHPKSTTPFNLPQALAYSCNDYFGHVGERISASAVNATLAGFGFGARTGVNAGGEVAGQLITGEWRAQEALGDSANLLVTPVQLLAAYTALVNGGRLYRPQQGEAGAQLKAKVNLAERQRAVLLEGMRGAVKFGTADKAQLDQLPVYVFGKTGTSTASNGFQTQGWFVGFVAPPRDSGLPAPEEIKLGFVVLLKRAHGSQGAEIAKRMLDCGLGLADCGLAASVIERRGDGEIGGTDFAVHSTARFPQTVRVRLGNPQSAIRHPQSKTPPSAIKELPFEAYVAGVVAAEGSVETQAESLKALAVVSRTYAMQNLGRHAREGFDFCSTTHCQQFWLDKTPTRETVRRAVTQTAGEILQDRQGHLAESYFHAACGGQTANLETLWGVRAPEHLRGVRDDYCATRPNRNWTCEITAAQLAQALRGDTRTDVGARLESIAVLQRDASGRAQTLAVTGARRRVLSGWDFKMLVGRKLGWQLLKSSWFEVQRRGERFVFTGHGFGHGLGLCQEGAHVMATRGLGYQQILAFYFPGVASSLAGYGARNGSDRMSPATYTTAARGGMTSDKRATLAGEHFRVSYPVSLAVREVEQILRLLETARADLTRRVEQASLVLPVNSPIEVFVHANTAEFITATGQTGWVAAVTRGRRIETQPLALLQKRGILTTTLRHELTHVAIEMLGQGHTPHWLAEGLALWYAGEGRTLAKVKSREPLTVAELERRLARPANAATKRELYALAYQQVRLLLRTEGEAAVWRRVAKN
ncbi:MAG: SpoIID/LytB domain-containing protein [Acidobacteria bacterium]|nr:SpoIID/LytB domain-containing protein [Acidobacteriota bacterium]MBI3426899.1 SpoIID/LytB domain-containing protein [Acidobacteriota bacterium]